MVSVYNGENSNKIFILTAARVKYLIEESINGEVETDYAGFNDKMFVKIKANAIPETEFNYQVYNLSKKILLGKSDDIVHVVGIGVHDRSIKITVQVHAAGFFCKHGGNAKAACHRVGNGNAGGFHSENTGHPFVFEMLIKSIADLLQKRDIHLVVEETVHLEDIPLSDLSVLQDSLFQKIHTLPLPDA